MLKQKIRFLTRRLSEEFKDDDSKATEDAKNETKHVTKETVNKVATTKAIASPVPPIIEKRINGIAAKRLMREYETCYRISQCTDPAFVIELVENSLIEWNIRLYHIDQDSRLYRDMRTSNISHILLNIRFPDNFPFAPPFLRVVHPRISNGYVLSGGAICMELLTTRGWSSVYTIEAMIMQFSSQVVKGNGRLHDKYNENYHKKEAELTFKKLTKFHDEKGWYTPPTSEG
ncbi:ubiquitin-conjugating enzyme E2Q-like protein 1 [Hydractinia symbiolongicarpus]|uniref:ubiquitin-conjugating enzyme E2Q-like protein 1 n=1 Tax=Hydractinia symbiolongicarpus TaxID=13093 RepID=UPI0025500CA0|nr:ubiquitin-conjugating enzyme E2Q-like protein 1 [Hydractinia symbiolongicarpus]